MVETRIELRIWRSFVSVWFGGGGAGCCRQGGAPRTCWANVGLGHFGHFKRRNLGTTWPRVVADGSTGRIRKRAPLRSALIAPKKSRSLGRPFEARLAFDDERGPRGGV